MLWVTETKKWSALQHLFFSAFPSQQFLQMAFLLLKFNILLWGFVPSITSREVDIVIVIITDIIVIIAFRVVINTAIFITTIDYRVLLMCKYIMWLPADIIAASQFSSL